MKELSVFNTPVRVGDDGYISINDIWKAAKASGMKMPCVITRALLDMPVPLYRNSEIGLTGRFRFRRQMLTGLSVLQVEISIKRYRYPDPTPSNDSQITSEWRDATYEEAIRIQIDYGG